MLLLLLLLLALLLLVLLLLLCYRASNKGPADMDCIDEDCMQQPHSGYLKSVRMQI